MSGLWLESWDIVFLEEYDIQDILGYLRIPRGILDQGPGSGPRISYSSSEQDASKSLPRVKTSALCLKSLDSSRLTEDRLHLLTPISVEFSISDKGLRFYLTRCSRKPRVV